MKYYTIEKFTIHAHKERARRIREIRYIDRILEDSYAQLSGNFAAMLQDKKHSLELSLISK